MQFLRAISVRAKLPAGFALVPALGAVRGTVLIAALGSVTGGGEFKGTNWLPAVQRRLFYPDVPCQPAVAA